MWIRILKITQMLKSFNHDVKLINLSTRRTTDNNFDETMAVSRFRLDAAVKINALIRKHSPQLIFANRCLPAFLSCLRVKRVPQIFDMHGYARDELLLSNDYWKKNILSNTALLMEKIALETSDKVFCVSKTMMQYNRIRYDTSYDKMEYITNGVDLERFKPIGDGAQPTRTRLGIDKKFVIGYIGGMQPWQGVEEFINAAHATNDERFAFLIVGGNSVWRKRDIIKLPSMSREAIPKYYAACDVLVLPRPINVATAVAAPTKFAEYVAMGKPVLVTDVGDASFLTRQYRCGFVARSNKCVDLIEGFRYLKALSDEELCKMSEQSRKLAVDLFDWKKISNKINSVIENL